MSQSSWNRFFSPSDMPDVIAFRVASVVASVVVSSLGAGPPQPARIAAARKTLSLSLFIGSSSR